MEDNSMKNFVVFTVLALVIVCSCFAQNTAAERLIVGTWTDNGNRTWVFAADGSFTVTNLGDGGGRYTGTQLFINPKFAFNISKHFNGKIIILTNNSGSESFLLIKN